ncbi:MAG: tetratricopeptide repeat protein [Acidobacteria bacterium]|nr:tetratricopeptide repeat protein [Acidobacteriota bacterium]
MRRIAIRSLTTAAIAAMLVVVLPAQAPQPVQSLFDAGQYQQVVDMTPADAPAPAVFLAGQSQQKLGNTAGAAALYATLAARPEADPWHGVGLAATALMQGNLDAALAAAQAAVNTDGALPEAHFQLGLVQARRQEWPAAAAAFDRVTQLAPMLAYAYYYGGLMHYRANRPDRMASHFETFLRLAPQAPERPEVLQIMRTIRGR